MIPTEIDTKGKQITRNANTIEHLNTDNTIEHLNCTKMKWYNISVRTHLTLAPLLVIDRLPVLQTISKTIQK